MGGVMNAMELFLREHAAVHTVAVGGSDTGFTVDWMFEGVSDAHYRVLPHGLNSIAWLLWHLARVEDACLSNFVFGTAQELDEPGRDWTAQLRVSHRGDGENMSKADVAALSAAIDLGALRDYRDAVGRRTRRHALALWQAGRWQTPVSVDDRASLADEAAGFAGQPRDALLWWWGVQHNAYHLGQLAMIRAKAAAPTENPQGAE